MIFAEGKLQFKPLLTELGEWHYKDLKRFMRLPKQQRGLSRQSAHPGFLNSVLDS